MAMCVGGGRGSRGERGGKGGGWGCLAAPAESCRRPTVPLDVVGSARHVRRGGARARRGQRSNVEGGSGGGGVVRDSRNGGVLSARRRGGIARRSTIIYVCAAPTARRRASRGSPVCVWRGIYSLYMSAVFRDVTLRARGRTKNKIRITSLCMHRVLRSIAVHPRHRRPPCLAMVLRPWVRRGPYRGRRGGPPTALARP